MVVVSMLAKDTFLGSRPKGVILSEFQQISDQAGDDGRIKLGLRETFPIKFRYAVFLPSDIQAGDDGCVKSIKIP